MNKKVLGTYIRMYYAATVDVSNGLDCLDTPFVADCRRNRLEFIVQVALKIAMARLSKK